MGSDRQKVAFATTMGLLVAFGSAPSVSSIEPEQAAFVGTTLTNEHFVMEIEPTKAISYSLDRTETLSTMLWILEEHVGDSWLPLDWTSGPVLSQEDAGEASEFHRVVVQGIVDDAVAVGIFFDGKAVDVPSAGAKISVAIQPFERGGTFRLAWVFDGISAAALQLETRVGDARTVVAGPLRLPREFSFPPMGENSIVALGDDPTNVRFGMNWQDANDHYQGTTATFSEGQT